MLKFLNLQSGSAGNATLIYSKKTLILVDMGVSLTCLKDGLFSIHKKYEDIKAVFLTHNHSDHVSGVPLLHGDFPLYGDKNTYPGIMTLKKKERFKVGDIEVVPVRSSHDAPDPLNYIFYSGETSLAYITDTGVILDETLKLIGNCTYYYMESNYDYLMLQKSKRPKFLKDRISSECGHLSNADSAIYSASLVGDKTKAIYLAHISADCNTHEEAIATYKRIFFEKSVKYKIDIIATNRYTSCFGGDDNED